MLPVNSLNSLLVNLGVVIYHQHVWDPVARTQGHLKDDVRRVCCSVRGTRVGPCWRGGRRAPAPDRSLMPTWGGPPVDPNHAAAARREGKRVEQAAGPRGPPWYVGRPRTTGRRRRHRASDPANRRAGGRGQLSYAGRSAHPAACCGIPGGCAPVTPRRQARTGDWPRSVPCNRAGHSE